MSRLEKARQHAEGLYRSLPDSLVYHNLQHAQDVLQAARRLAAMENLSGADRELLELAALYHDVGYTVCYRDNEKEAVRIVRENCPGLGYAPGEVQTACHMILATAMPQKPGSPLESLLCDADLDNLGREDFFERMELVFAEKKAYGQIESRANFLKQSLELMENHHYFSAAAQKLRNAGKAANMEALRKLVHRQSAAD